jgi:hypothetical protein
MDTPTSENTRDMPASDGGQTTLLIIAWLWVGIPLLWGVYQTLMKSLPLFRV